jgi:hypothetical protein
MSDHCAPAAPASSPSGDPAAGSPGRSVDDLQGSLTQTIGDLADIARWLPCASREDADRAALLLTALAAECVEAANMCRAIGTGQERRR